MPILMLDRSMRYLLLAVTASVLITVAAPTQVHAGQIQGSPATYRSLLGRLQPGDDLLLESGTYRDGLPLHNMRGTLDRPIRILGPKTGLPAVFVGRNGHNTVSLSNTAYVHLGHLILDGRSLEVNAVKAEGSKQCVYVHDIALENLLIVRHGHGQQIVGISSMCPAWNWIIRRNVILGAGTGLYLGRPDGSAPFVAGLIEQNLLVDTLGYNLQIKHQTKRKLENGMPSGQARTVIRHNVFTKARHASSGSDARPNLLLGHFPEYGVGSEDVYEVTSNIFFCNPGESLLQAEGNLAISRNVFYNPAGAALALQPHHGIPRRILIDSNFVATPDAAISITKASRTHPQMISNNWIFSPIALHGGKQHGNRIGAYPPLDEAFTQWLGTIDSSSMQSETFAPLVSSIAQMCSGEVTDRLRNIIQMDDTLRNHPVCKLLELIASSLHQKHPRFTGPEAAHSQCNWHPARVPNISNTPRLH